MTVPTNTPFNPRVAVPAANQADEMLARFFRSALPAPWPPCPQLATKDATLEKSHRRASKSWSRWRRRFAAAAVISGLVLGFHALQTSFVEPKSELPSMINSRQMGMNTQPIPPIDGGVTKDDIDKANPKKQN